MSLRFTDILIALAEPRELLKYRKDPTLYLSQTILSDEERTTLLSGNPAEFRRRASSQGASDRQNSRSQFPRDTVVNEILIDELHVELAHIPTTTDISTISPGAQFIDEKGQRYYGRCMNPKQAA
jgi:hypothetical protein